MTNVRNFSTDNIEKDSRIDAVEDILGKTLARLEVKKYKGQPLKMEMTSRPLGSIVLASFDVGLISFKRKQEHLCDDDDRFSLVSCTSGVYDVYSPEGEGCPVFSGMTSLISHRQATTTQALQPNSFRTLVMPRDLVCETLRRPDQLVGAAPKGGLAALGLLNGYVANLMRQNELLSPKLQQIVEGQLLDLLANAFDPMGEWSRAAPHEGVQTARRQSLLALLAGSYSDVEASAQKFGVQLGLSTRLVHQLLEETGMTFSEHIMEHRLQAARRALRSPRFVGQRISNIALHVGFSDISYFNRSFRRRFGDTPKAFR